MQKNKKIGGGARSRYRVRGSIVLGIGLGIGKGGLIGLGIGIGLGVVLSVLLFLRNTPQFNGDAHGQTYCKILSL